MVVELCSQEKSYVLIFRGKCEIIVLRAVDEKLISNVVELQATLNIPIHSHMDEQIRARS